MCFPRLFLLNASFCLTTAFAAMAGAKEPHYPVAALAPALRENAHAVVRAAEETLLVKSIGRTVHTVHRVTTVLDEAGAHWATQLVYYDQLSSVSYLRGTVYDAEGQALRQLRTADVKDYSLSDGFSLATDARGRIADLRQPNYPYTVSFEYEVVSDNPLFYTTWRPQDDEQLAVEQATFRVLTPASLPLRFQERHLPSGTTVARSQQGDSQVYQWELKALPAQEEEPYGPPLTEMVPSVATAPTSFEVQGHRGTLTSWQTLGQWTYDLNNGRDVLPATVQARVAELVKDAPDERARISRVYDLLQSSTRYVSIQLGLGGWQTMPAASVGTTGYGDCKALSNYCMALLKAAGIQSYCALVRADEPDINTDFPSSQFNHVVLCVPLTKAAKRDTVWLECTSQNTALGYMGSFTGNRHALLLTPSGGQLVRTPRYGATENRQERRADVYLDAQGSATATLHTRRTGLEQDRFNQLLHGLDPAQQKEKIAESLPLSNFNITKFGLVDDKKASIPTVNETLGLTLPQFGTPSGRRVFVLPNLLSRLPAVPASVGERQTDIWLASAFTHADTVRIHVPAGFHTESIPAPVKLTTAFGTYSAQIQTLPDGTLQYVRSLQMPRTRFPRTDYPAYVEFRRKISAADKAQVVLVKTES
jgi:transglutaminase-like putative cysteine protease